MPRSKKEGWISWRGSEARNVLMMNLIDGILPVEAKRVPAEEAWEIYKTMDEFANVVFDQFNERLTDHRKQVGENKIRAAKELDALAHDRCLFPRQPVNHRGELVFDLHPAKLLLRADVKAGKTLVRHRHACRNCFIFHAERVNVSRPSADGVDDEVA